MAGESLKLGQLGPMSRYVLSQGSLARRSIYLGSQGSFPNTTNRALTLFGTAIPVQRERSPVTSLSAVVESDGYSSCVDQCFNNLVELQSRMPDFSDLGRIKVTATDKEKAKALLDEITATSEALNGLLDAASNSGLEISNDHSNEDKRQSPPPFSQTVDVESALLSLDRPLSPSSSRYAPQGASVFRFGAIGSICRAGTPPA